MSRTYPYGYTMAANYEDGLEAAPQNFPEVAHQPPPQQPAGGYVYPPHHHPQAYADAPLAKHGQYSPDPSTVNTAAPYSTVPSPYSSAAGYGPAGVPVVPPGLVPPGAAPTKSARTVCGCSILVFILSCIIALLSAAVIGLAAGTGVEAARANDATAQLQALRASVSTNASADTTTSGSAPTSSSDPTSFAAIDDGCSVTPETTNGTIYTSFSLLGGLKFRRLCNRDAANAPLLSLFVADFDACMDACAAYTKYVPTNFGTEDIHTTCEAVSFIPLWTVKANASDGQAPGNCYLKPGPQNSTNIKKPNIGTDCHAGVYIAGS